MATAYGLATGLGYGRERGPPRRAGYVPTPAVVAEQRIDGRVLVYTTQADDEKLVTGGAAAAHAALHELMVKAVADVRRFQLDRRPVTPSP